MPELPDIEAYRYALDARITGSSISALRIDHPFFLRSADQPPESCVGKQVRGVGRLAKRLVVRLDDDSAIVLHLMVGGRLRFGDGVTELPPRRGRAPRGASGALGHVLFSTGLLTVTETGTHRRAALHIVADQEALAGFHRGGIEVLSADLPTFTEALERENHTLKRTLTDQRLFSGIGNAYSDEILFAARLSPFKMSTTLRTEEVHRLYEATRSVLTEWRDRLVGEARKRFPAKVTAFREEMHVHGKYGQPCSVCRTPVQRIRYADNESNYCPTCQTEGRVLADRALSRLLKSDWPRTVEELERNPGISGSG